MPSEALISPRYPNEDDEGMTPTPSASASAVERGVYLDEGVHAHGGAVRLGSPPPLPQKYQPAELLSLHGTPSFRGALEGGGGVPPPPPGPPAYALPLSP